MGRPDLSLFQSIHSQNCTHTCRQTLEGAGLSNTYGLSIIAFTVLIKLVTLPLNYKQIESTTKMQAIQPMVRTIETCPACPKLPLAAFP